MSEYELRSNLITRFETLHLKIETLCQAIRADDTLVAWMHDFGQFSRNKKVHPSHRETACSIIRQLEYHDEQAPREIIISAGFLGASKKTLELAEDLNQEKLLFKSAILSLKPLKISLKDPVLSEHLVSILKKRAPVVSQSLHSTGLARIHLKQCYRQLPILSQTPHKISWTWAHTRSIKKISVQEAERLLRQKGSSEGIERQRERLSTLSPHESLAIIQELAPHLRANLVFQFAQETQRMMIKGPMPILFPATPQTPYPSFKPPKDKQGKNKNRLIRNDVKIDPTPFLPSIRAHRYR